MSFKIFFSYIFFFKEQEHKKVLEYVNMLVIKQQQKALVISENKQVTKKGEERSETKETETDNEKGK